MKLENLLLIGYSPARVALPYSLLTVGLNLLVLLLSVAAVVSIRAYYVEAIRSFFPQIIETASLLPCILTGGLLFIAVSALNVAVIHRKIQKIWKGA